MHKCNISAVVLGSALLIMEGCTSPPEPQMVYDYALTVTDVRPISGPQSSMVVEMFHGPAIEKRHGPRTSQNYARLYAYSRYYEVKAATDNEYPQSRLVPQDTVLFSLSRAQTDTIYRLARQVFTLPEKPVLRLASTEAPFPMHDLDNYLSVSFRPFGYAGPTLKCSGYSENNAAGYRLQSHLLRLKQKITKQP